jgi:hypothetical protein
MPLLGWKSATFVSLQYGDIQKDLETLRELTGGRVIHDTEINQLVDLDGFRRSDCRPRWGDIDQQYHDRYGGNARGAHVHIRDDNLSSAIWPRSGPSPWYPDMIFLYRERLIAQIGAQLGHEGRETVLPRMSVLLVFRVAAALARR